jgi:hypothetical protein
LLLGWRWLSFLAGVGAVVLALLPAVTPGVSLAGAGDGIAAVWSRVPGHELVSGTIDGFGAVVAIGLGSIGLGAVTDWLGWLGPHVLGAMVPVLAAFAIYSRGVGSWRTADASERQLIRRERFGPSGRAWARSEAVLLVGGLLAIVLAALGPRVELMIAWLVAVAAAALVVRRA